MDAKFVSLTRSQLIEVLRTARAGLAGEDLSGVDLGHANLRGTNLSGANLSFTSLGGANLCEADLSSGVR